MKVGISMSLNPLSLPGILKEQLQPDPDAGAFESSVTEETAGHVTCENNENH